MAKWIARNWINLLILAVLAGLLTWFLWGKSPLTMATTTLTAIQVVVGLGLVIFIHELGHFAAAKLCGVRVHTFSLGFGPAIPGLGYQYGETFYKIAVFPIGGYVQMLGENPSEAAEGEVADDPRSFKNKTVGQRMIIISAGVVMNAILGLLCFIYVYHPNLGGGCPKFAPRFGVVEPGSPADQAGIKPGSTITRIHDDSWRGRLLGTYDDTNPTFNDLLIACSLATPNETEIEIEYIDPSGHEGKAFVKPRKLETDDRPVIGVQAIPFGLTLNRKAPEGKSPAEEGSPAAAAAFLPGDQLVGVSMEDGKDYREFKNGWDLSRAAYDFRGKPVKFKFLRDGNHQEVQVDPNYFYVLPGVRMKTGPIRSIGPNAPEEVKKLKPGDTITAIDGQEGFDPMRLPDLIMDKALAGQDVELTVQREGQSPIKVVIHPKDVQGRGTWNESRPFSLQAPVGIPALGIAYEVLPVVGAVEPKSAAAERGLREGDVIEQVTFKRPEGSQEKDFVIDLKEKDGLQPKWPFVFVLLQSGPKQDGKIKVEVRVKDRGEPVTLWAEQDKTWANPDYRFILEPEEKIVRAESTWDAMMLGLSDTTQTIGQIFLFLKGLATRTVSPKNMIGPIGIAQAAYAMADRGFNYFVLLLGIISVNLAVVNFMPIPMLDGGHMLFLILEKIRRKPASERMLIIANVVGLALILCLFLFVCYLDIRRNL